MILSELKSLGIQLIGGFDDLVSIWKYLIENISIDFANRTIDYYSLFRTVSEINFIINKEPPSSGSTLRLSKRFALLWVYLRHIRMNNCNVIFDIPHCHRALIIHLSVDFGIYSYNVNEFYPSRLKPLFKILSKTGPPQLNCIMKLLRNNNLEYESRLLGIPKKISSFSKLARSIPEKCKRELPDVAWRVRALAELEIYLTRRCQKIDYSAI